MRSGETGSGAVDCLSAMLTSSRVHTHAYFMSSRPHERRFSQDDSGTLVRYLSR